MATSSSTIDSHHTMHRFVEHIQELKLKSGLDDSSNTSNNNHTDTHLNLHHHKHTLWKMLCVGPRCLHELCTSHHYVERASLERLQQWVWINKRLTSITCVCGYKLWSYFFFRPLELSKSISIKLALENGRTIFTIFIRLVITVM